MQVLYADLSLNKLLVTLNSGASSIALVILAARLLVFHVHLEDSIRVAHAHVSSKGNYRFVTDM